MSSTQFQVDLQLEILSEAICGPNNEENPTEKIDIVAVPGIGLAAKDPWRDGEVNWLKDDTMLRYWLPNARIMHASYDWEGFRQDRPIQHLLPLLARELVRASTAKRRTCPKRPLIFIGHSLGGLIVKQAALLSELHHDEYQLLRKSLVGIALFGTPHRATSLKSSETVSLDTSLDDPRSVVQKEPSSFATLSWDFARVAIVHHIPVCCFFEQPPEGKALVDEQFSTIPGFKNTALTTDHLHLCKYAEPSDYNYKLVRDELIAFVQGSADCLARRKDFCADKVNASLKALLTTDPADDIDIIEHNKGPLLQGSGSWLQADPNFNEWLNCKKGRVFWLHGNSGKGKTMLSLSVLKDITEEIKASGSGPSVLVAQFFC
ncbi:hypothetical protein F5Y08DRAFT_142852 [Xylaria arbuscula]|nr:hypothetical protein F5Y08DRAFT_142852 [Xylaria arbuscula]